MKNFGQVVIINKTGTDGRWVSRSGKSMWDKEGYAKLALRSHWEYDEETKRKFPNYKDFAKLFSILVFDLSVE